MNKLGKYLRILGKKDPQISRLEATAERSPQMIANIVRFCSMMVEERAGCNITELPPYTISQPSGDYLHAVCIGTGLCGNKPGYDYLLDLDSFTQSGLIVGTPRVGKSKLAQVIAMGVVGLC